MIFQLKHEIHGKPFAIPFNRLNESFGFDIVEPGKVIAEHHPMAPNEMNLILNTNW
jgi:hypothetical protein